MKILAGAGGGRDSSKTLTLNDVKNQLPSNAARDTWRDAFLKTVPDDEDDWTAYEKMERSVKKTRILGRDAHFATNALIRKLVPRQGDVANIVGWTVWSRDFAHFTMLPTKENAHDIEEYVIFHVGNPRVVYNFAPAYWAKQEGIVSAEEFEESFKPGDLLWMTRDKKDSGYVRADDNGSGAIIGDSGDNSYGFVVWVKS